MWTQSFVASLLLTLACVLYLLDAVSFLAPYRRTLFANYLEPALWFLAMWVLALSVGIYMVVRLLTLGRVGKRLHHVSRDGVPLDTSTFPAAQDDDDA